MRMVLFIVLAALACASLASAQVPTSGNVFFGYSYYNADLSSLGRSNLNGWTGSLEGKVLPWVGMVADFSETYGSESITILCPGPSCPSESINAHEYNMLFGPRLSVSVGKVRPFAEALFGVGHVGTNSITASFAPSRCVSRETTCRRASSARPRTTSGCPLESYFVFEPPCLEGRSDQPPTWPGECAGPIQ